MPSRGGWGGVRYRRSHGRARTYSRVPGAARPLASALCAALVLLVVAACSTTVTGVPVAVVASAPTTGGESVGTIAGPVLVAPSELEDQRIALSGALLSVYNAVTGAQVAGPAASDSAGQYAFQVPGGATYLVCAQAPAAALVATCTQPGQVPAKQTTTVQVAVPQAQPSGPCDPGQFLDIDNEAQCPDITWLLSTGMTAGVDATHYAPENPVMRGQFAMLLYRLAHSGSDAPACSQAPFNDVPAQMHACGAIDWLVEAKLVDGPPARSSFGPGAPVSRHELAVMLYRLQHSETDAPGCERQPFADVPADSPSCGAVTWLAQTGITVGTAGRFEPDRPVARWQLAAFLHRMASVESISGTVRNTDGDPVSGVGVIATGLGGNDNSYSAVTWDGQYRMPIVAPGSYRVCFVGASADPAPESGYRFSCFDNVVGAGAPTPVTVSAGESTTVDAVLAAPDA